MNAISSEGRTLSAISESIAIAGARASAALTVLSSRQAIVIGPTPPGTGVTAPSDPLDRVEVDVADQTVLAACGADVDHDRAGLDHVGADQLRRTDAGDEHVGACASPRRGRGCASGKW